MRKWANVERRLRNIIVILMPILVVACATTKDYEICNTPGCGDNVTVEVTK